jgi:ADP-heptose:LPS heptosyltransferase
LRDIPLESFREAAELPEVRLVSLQNDRENLAAETKDLPIFVPGDDVDTVLGAFMDTAAIIRNLDLVITSDTAVAHLAGALGVPVWTLLPVNADWRWLLVRDDSPWYPTMRLFRQNSLGNWKGVFGEVVKALQELVNRPQDREMAKE